MFFYEFAALLEYLFYQDESEILIKFYTLCFLLSGNFFPLFHGIGAAVCSSLQVSAPCSVA